MTDTELPVDVWLKKHAKTGEEIFDNIDSCWDRHCTHLNMKPEEVPEYEKDLKECNEEKWVSVPEIRTFFLAKERSLRKLLDSPELLEDLASLEHQQWSMLMAYIKSVSIEEKDIVEQLQSKWKEWRQLGNTPYANLTEKQKESDRMFARDVIKILKEKVFDETSLRKGELK